MMMPAFEFEQPRELERLIEALWRVSTGSRVAYAGFDCAVAREYVVDEARASLAVPVGARLIVVDRDLGLQLGDLAGAAPRVEFLILDPPGGRPGLTPGAFWPSLAPVLRRPELTPHWFVLCDTARSYGALSTVPWPHPSLLGSYDLRVGAGRTFSLRQAWLRDDDRPETDELPRLERVCRGLVHELTDEHQMPVLRGYAAIRMAQTALRAGAVRAVVTPLLVAEAQARTAGGKAVHGRMLSARGRLLAELGDPQAAIVELEQARQCFTELRDPAQQALVLAWLSEAQAAAGIRAARTQAETALALASSSGSLTAWAAAQRALGESQLLAGAPFEALQHYEAALLSSLSRRDRPAQAATMRRSATALSKVGRGDEADSYLARAAQLAAETGDRAEQARGLFTRGQIQMGRHQHSAAAEAFGRALRFYESRGHRRMIVRCLRGLANCRQAERQFRGAQECLGRAQELERTLLWPEWRQKVEQLIIEPGPTLGQRDTGITTSTDSTAETNERW